MPEGPSYPCSSETCFFKYHVTTKNLSLFFSISIFNFIDFYMTLHVYTKGPHYNDSVCYQRFCYKIKFAVIKKLDVALSKA